MFRRLSAVVIGLSLMTSAFTAKAQEATVEEARAHADSVIAKAGAGEWFSNITTTDTPTVRHIPSGMTCELVGFDEDDEIVLFRRGGGEDVACVTWIGRTLVSLYATRYVPEPSEEEVLDAATAALMQNWPQANALDRDFEIMLLQGQAPPLMAVFDVELDGRARRSVILVRNAEGWSFKARATGPADDDTAVEFGTMAFALAMPGAYDSLQD